MTALNSVADVQLRSRWLAGAQGVHKRQCSQRCSCIPETSYAILEEHANDSHPYRQTRGLVEGRAHTCCNMPHLLLLLLRTCCCSQHLGELLLLLCFFLASDRWRLLLLFLLLPPPAPLAGPQAKFACSAANFFVCSCKPGFFEGEFLEVDSHPRQLVFQLRDPCP